MAWCQTGTKPFPEPMIMQFTEFKEPGLNALNDCKFEQT